MKCEGNLKPKMIQPSASCQLCSAVNASIHEDQEGKGVRRNAVTEFCCSGCRTRHLGLISELLECAAQIVQGCMRTRWNQKDDMCASGSTMCSTGK